MTLPLLCGSLVGIALGLTGGGGSIFAVPLLLYVLGVPLREAVTVSLAVVGLTALYGAVFQRKMVNWGPGIVFGAGGIAGAPAGAWLGARLPEFLTLLLFAGLMLFIGVRMLRSGNSGGVLTSRLACRRDSDGVVLQRWICAGKLFLAGSATGILSGTFGVGGGFLVVPAILLVTGMSIERGLATSLVCITLISASAFFSNIIGTHDFPVILAGWFLAGGVLGMTAGAAIKARFSAVRLKRIFAISVITVGLWIAIQTLLGKSVRHSTKQNKTTASDISAGAPGE